jgi:uncharacterized repeat protein (TIGR03803 family)
MRDKSGFVFLRFTCGRTLILAIFGFALTLFAVQTAASQEQVLYNFFNVGDSVNPVAGVIADAAGNLYGTTFYSGAYGNGMVFELTATAGGWEEKVLHSFNPNGIDGFGVTGGLIFDAAGNIYGTTEFGGPGNAPTALAAGPCLNYRPRQAEPGRKPYCMTSRARTDGRFMRGLLWMRQGIFTAQRPMAARTARVPCLNCRRARMEAGLRQRCITLPAAPTAASRGAALPWIQPAMFTA